MSLKPESPPPGPTRVVNRLIGSLPRQDARRMEALCEAVDLVPGSVLCEANELLEHAYFPLTGFISLVTPMAGHEPLETEHIGSEGMLGVTLALDIPFAPQRGLVQGAGSALRMTAGQLRSATHDSPALLRLLRRYLYVVMVQLSRTTGCARFHEVEARLARGLLMIHDRAHADHFHQTHQSLADMLGVQRGAVTIAAGHLQQKGAIHYSRGKITIADRKVLEGESCSCYAAVAADYARLLPG
ncbi:MAG: Crp/Fnr family transcriptional regulator [Gammaproteobacteria bacterium]|nr:Crp/Fnr family transcriptional regulator [Gammaproteobacteria bacterium]